MNQPFAKTILWLTENYYPNRGGMAQSCDRIVNGLRDSGLNIGLVHFRSSKNKLRFKYVKNGFYLSFPVDEDSGHSLNLVYNYLCNPSYNFNFSQIVAFGGFLPLLAGPILSQLLDIYLISLLRGNDFDVSLFSVKKRDFLFYALENSTKICTVTIDQKDKIEKLLKHKNVYYIPNGIELENWQVHKSELEIANSWLSSHVSDNKRVIGVFGHLKPKKGLEFFINSILRSGLSDKLFLLITGDIYPEMNEKLLQSGIEYQLIPFMDRYELLSWYPVCNAVAIPSFYDGMPNVLLEAAALSLPIIAARVGGMKDMLEDGLHGFLFHPGDEEDCAEALHKFIEADTSDLEQIGRNCNELVQTKYSIKIEINNYLKLFEH